MVLHDPFAMHVARLCLMLADHHYSSLTDPEAQRTPYRNKDYPLYANTRSNHYQKDSCSRLLDKRQSPLFNQTLDEHLLGVQAHATLVARSLPSLTHSLPALKNHKPLKKRSADPRFAWQDKAADLATSVRARAAQQGAFIVNMASTGLWQDAGQRPGDERAGRPSAPACAAPLPWGCARSRCKPGACSSTTCN